MSDNTNTEHAPLTAAELAEMREREQKATAGPWAYRGIEHDDWGIVRTIIADNGGFGPTVAKALSGYYPHAIQNGVDPYGHNANFIAHARADVPRLLAEVERLRVQNERLRNAECPTCGKALSPDGDCYGCEVDRLRGIVREMAKKGKIDVREDGIPSDEHECAFCRHFEMQGHADDCILSRPDVRAIIEGGEGHE